MCFQILTAKKCGDMFDLSTIPYNAICFYSFSGPLPSPGYSSAYILIPLPYYASFPRTRRQASSSGDIREALLLLLLLRCRRRPCRPINRGEKLLASRSHSPFPLQQPGAGFANLLLRIRHVQGSKRKGTSKNVDWLDNSWRIPLFTFLPRCVAGRRRRRRTQVQPKQGAAAAAWRRAAKNVRRTEAAFTAQQKFRTEVEKNTL